MLKQYKKIIIALVILTLGFIYYLIIKFLGIGIPCIFYEITHLYCPGCGATRTLMSLFELEFYQAFRYNSIIFIAIPTLLIESQLRKHGKTKISTIIVLILTFIVLAYGILRNFNMFSFLQPTIVL